jgi:hypothetical protein
VLHKSKSQGSFYFQGLYIQSILTQYYYFLKDFNPIIIIIGYGTKKADEHLRHPVCEVCQKEFDNVHELSKHVNAEHRNQDRAA